MRKKFKKYGERCRTQQGKLREVAGKYRSLYIWFKTRTSNQQSKVSKSLYIYFLAVLIPLKFHQPQPNGGQLATIFPGSMVKCSLSMFQRNERVVLVCKRKRYKCSQVEIKIVNVKTLADEHEVYVKAMIKKSYGFMQRSTVIMFENGIPSKAHCSCPVGISGICCHVLALLLFLKHYHETGERILALTSTEQLQKWHRCSHEFHTNGTTEGVKS